MNRKSARPVGAMGRWLGAIALVKDGTRVEIARTQPEDATLGRSVPRPVDYLDPDPPNSFLISGQAVAPRTKPVFAN